MTTTTFAPGAPTPDLDTAADTTECYDCRFTLAEDEAVRTDCRDDADRCDDCAFDHIRLCSVCSTEAAATAD